MVVVVVDRLRPAAHQDALAHRQQEGGEVDEMDDAAPLALGFAAAFEHGREDGLGADDAGVGPQHHDDILGGGDELVDQVSEGADVGAEVGEARVGADGGEGEPVGGVAVFGEAGCDEREA